MHCSQSFRARLMKMIRKPTSPSTRAFASWCQSVLFRYDVLSSLCNHSSKACWILKELLIANSGQDIGPVPTESSSLHKWLSLLEIKVKWRSSLSWTMSISCLCIRYSCRGEAVGIFEDKNYRFFQDEIFFSFCNIIPWYVDAILFTNG